MDDITKWLQQNNNSVFVYRWFSSVERDHFMCEQFFKVVNGKLFEISHSQKLIDKINFEKLDITKLEKVRPRKKYIWNNYYFKQSDLKKISTSTFNKNGKLKKNLKYYCSVCGEEISKDFYKDVKSCWICKCNEEKDDKYYCLDCNCEIDENQFKNSKLCFACECQREDII